MCNENLKHAPIMPIAAKPSQYGIDPSLVKRRVAELPGMCSLRLAELFPELPPVIYPGGQDALDKLYQVAMEELRKVDMSFIKPGQSVNILASHHGFTLLGGQPYAILIKPPGMPSSKRPAVGTCACGPAWVCASGRRRSISGAISWTSTSAPARPRAWPLLMRASLSRRRWVPLRYQAVYDADWIVHCHHTDVREVHFHRQVDKAVKPFGMSYARIETRSTYHQNLGPRAANFTARAIFESPFVQSKFAFASFLNVGPHASSV